MELISTRVTNYLADCLRRITEAGDYPVTLATIEIGQFYEDLPQGAALPVATLIAASSGLAETPAGVVASGRRSRAYQIEVVVDFDQHPGIERHVLLDQIEWGIGRALSQPPPRELRAMLQTVQVGEVQFNYPAPGHSIAIVQAQVAVSFIEQYPQT